MTSSDLTYTRCVCCLFVVCLLFVCGCVCLFICWSVTDCIPYKLDDLVRPYVHKVCLLIVCLCVCLWVFVGVFVCLFAGQSH